jgi:hypothetical protein
MSAITSIEVKLAVDLGDLPDQLLQRVVTEIRGAFDKAGRPHIKVNYRETTHPAQSGMRKAEIAIDTMGNTSIGEAIVSTIGNTWNARDK